MLTGLRYSGQAPRVALAIGLVVVLTAVVAAGVRRSTESNAVILADTLLGLVAFVAAGAPRPGSCIA